MAYKCRHCKETIKVKEAYIAIIDKKRACFCNEDHYNLFISEQEKRKEYENNRNDCLILICEIFDQKNIINTALWKEWKQWTQVASSEIIKRYLEENKSFLHDAISKIENGEFYKIRYLSAILKNNLVDYQNCQNTALKPMISENDMRGAKTIYGLQAKYSDLSMFTNAYIDMYLDTTNKWDSAISIEDMMSFISVANILNEDEIAKRIAEMSYDNFLCTPYWKAISDYVKHKFNCVCKLCKSTDNLNVHHKIYDNHGYEHRMNVIETDLTVLCRDCHKKIHGIK